MKLIEKKCPNCGAGLEFSDKDTSCKCNYCHRTFEIERDNIDTKNAIQQYTLNEINRSLQFIPIVAIVFLIITVIIMGFIMYSRIQTYQGEKKSDSTIEDTFQKYLKKEEKLYSDVNDLTNSDLEAIDNSSYFVITNYAEGVNDANHFYSRDGNPKRKKVYLAYKDKSNYLVILYQVSFKDFFQQENRYTFYVPIIYENVSKTKEVDKFTNPRVDAPEYYFNTDKSSFSYGFSNMEEAYKQAIEPLANSGYIITEK